MLQNYQLTTELEYQSKQTEKLFFKNQKLLEQVKALKRDVEIHKQVETELAKRSHFCEKLINKLKKRIVQIEEDCQELRAEIENNRSNAAALRDNNDMKERRLEMMGKDESTFEQNVALARNDTELVEAELTRLKGRYGTDLRRLRVLKFLLSRCLKGVDGTDNKHEEMENADDNKPGFSNLRNAEKEILFKKIVKAIDGQLEVELVYQKQIDISV